MRGKTSALSSLITAAALAMLAPGQHAAAQTPLGSTFTYQGELIDGGTPVNGTVNLTFRLYDAASLGNLIATNTILGVTVTDGRLTVTLDFGVGAFNGDRRWLEIDVDAITLSPRQEITVVPYALQTRGILVDAALNVGIGTLGPLYRFDVNRNAFNDFVARIRNTNGSTNHGLLIQAGRNNSPEKILEARADPGGETRFVVQSDGNVGIGTSSPTSHLHIYEDINGVVDLVIENPNTGASSRERLSFNNEDGTVAFIQVIDSGVMTIANNRPGGSIRLNTQGLTKFTLANNGNVGIGTTGPAARLAVEGPGTDIGGLPGFPQVVARFRQTSGGLATALSIDSLFNQDPILYLAEDGSALWSIRADVSDDGPRFEIRHQEAGVNNVALQTFEDAFFGGYRLVTHGAILPISDNLYPLGFSGFRWTAVWAANGTIQTSDGRLKTNVKELTNGLAAVRKLRPVRYQWKDRPEDNRTYLGLIAQETEPIVPEAVIRPEDPAAPLGTNYASLIPVLIKAMQEQDQIIRSQQSQIDDLRAPLADLKARLAVIEARIHQVAAQPKRGAR